MIEFKHNPGRRTRRMGAKVIITPARYKFLENDPRVKTALNVETLDQALNKEVPRNCYDDARMFSKRARRGT